MGFLHSVSWWVTSCQKPETATERLPMFTEDELLAISREFIVNEHRLSEPICRKIDEELSRRKGEHRV
jgi:hypothetical protein